MDLKRFVFSIFGLNSNLTNNYNFFDFKFNSFIHCRLFILTGKIIIFHIVGVLGFWGFGVLGLGFRV